MTRHTWDYPTQGTRFARTSAEAFGPYGGMRRPVRYDWRSAVMYCTAIVLIVAALVLAAL